MQHRWVGLAKLQVTQYECVALSIPVQDHIFLYCYAKLITNIKHFEAIGSTLVVIA